LNRGTLQNGTLTSTTNAFESINNSIVVTAVLNGAVGLNTTGAGDLILSAANTYTGTTNLGGTGKIRIGNNSALGTGTLSFNGGTLELNATLGVIANAMTATSGRTFLLSTSGANVYNATFSGNLTGDATNGLIKTGTGGTVTLSGTNTYGGNTTVNQGALTLSSSGQLRFLPGANGVSNKVTGAGTANLNGTLSINLANAEVANGNAWTLVDVTTRNYNLAGVTSINPALTFTNSSGVWTATDGGNTWTFTQATGVLGLATGASSAYDTFASVIPNAADRDPTDDPDADGISNLAEFVLGGSPIVSSQSILPTQVIDATNIVLSYKRTDASELAPATTSAGQYSTNLSTWTDVTPVLVNENGAAADDMTVTVPKSNAVNGKLFVRVRFVK